MDLLLQQIAAAAAYLATEPLVRDTRVTELKGIGQEFRVHALRLARA